MNQKSRIKNHGRRPCLRRNGGKASRYFNSIIHYSLFIILFATLTLTGLRCTRGPTAQEARAVFPVTLTWWRVFDDQEAVRPIIEAYRALHPNVTVQYRKLRFDEYEQALLNALAEDRGPDILSLHNSWVQAYLPKLVPLPSRLTIPFQELKGGLRKEVVVNLRTTPTLSPSDLRARFVDAVSGDVVVSARDERGQVSQQIVALPLALDTLALFSNRDLLNLAGVPQPPKTWNELQAATRRLTRLDREGKIAQSAVALGAARNVERASDILALLMMQNGAQMMDASGAAFHKIPQALERRPLPPGEEALVFYTDFANPQKEVYTWSVEQNNSLEAFLAGKTAMVLGYSYHRALIEARAPRLNLEITPAPQIESNPEVNFANYWLEAVSKKSRNQDWAWDFLQFAASAERVQSYLKATGKPTALRALVLEQQNDPQSGVFAAQVLTAKSWYRGQGAPAAEEALNQAIEAVAEGGKPRDALRVAAQRVNQTLR